MHAERCPICLGEGKIPDAYNAELVKCHGCGGKGWVEVKDDPKPEMEKKLVTNPEKSNVE